MKKSKSERSKLVNELDQVFSKYIRAKAGNVCFFQGRGQGEYKIGACSFGSFYCFHILSRVSYATRWDEENCVCSCAAHNMSMEYVPLEFYRLFEKLNGKVWLDNLRIKWKQPQRFTLEELREKIAYYQDKLKEITGPV